MYRESRCTSAAAVEEPTEVGFAAELMDADDR